MADFAKSTLDKLRSLLEGEKQRLEETLATFEEERESARLAVAPGEHNTDPDNVDGGALIAEMVKEISLEQNTRDLLAQVNAALKRMDDGKYGYCEICGQRIPLARLEALPHTSMCVACAAAR